MNSKQIVLNVNISNGETTSSSLSLGVTKDTEGNNLDFNRAPLSILVPTGFVGPYMRFESCHDGVWWSLRSGLGTEGGMADGSYFVRPAPAGETPVAYDAFKSVTQLRVVSCDADGNAVAQAANITIGIVLGRV